ncbi:MAG TPA: ABC transporter ATP-binding protein [Acidimicrobiales bacterium]|nr:ABC transporter ATP-binding protein [Acidimicrobiales bacterium]
MGDLLEVEHLTVRYGGLAAVDDVSLTVTEGQLVGLIGPNGAGKTTFVDALSGFVTASGAVRLAGRPIESLRPHRRARLGLSRTFQSLELFEDLTVRENLLISAEHPRWWSAIIDAARPTSSKAAGAVDWALEAVGIADTADHLPGSLSHGQRKIVAVARALASRPLCLLLDEPAAGLETAESQILGEQFQQIRDHGISILLVDHDMGLVLGICDYLYVLEFGKLIAKGAPAAVRRDPVVIRAYLGEHGEPESEDGSDALEGLGERGGTGGGGGDGVGQPAGLGTGPPPAGLGTGPSPGEPGSPGATDADGRP